MRKKKLFSIMLVLCMIISILAGCGKNATSTNTGESTKPTNTNESVIFTDSVGREVKLPAKITKIAPSGSLAQMVLLALAPDMFVGISGKWSPEAEKYLDTKYYNLPILGQFYGTKDLNLEEIAKVNPEVIIDIGDPKPTIKEDLDNITKQVNIPAIHINGTIDTMAEAYRTLGKLLGREQQGEALAKYCEQTYKKTEDIMNAVGENGKVKLLYCTGKDGLNVLSKGSIHSVVLDKVGDNAAALEKVSSMGSGDPVNMEQITLWDPDVIIFAPGSNYSTVATDPAWQKLKAIKNGKYYEVPNGPYNWMGSPPSVNLYMGMIWSTQLLYPEKAQYDAYKETAKYYELFYHCKLTEDQYKELVKNSLLKK